MVRSDRTDLSRAVVIVSVGRLPWLEAVPAKIMTTLALHTVEQAHM